MKKLILINKFNTAHLLAITQIKTEYNLIKNPSDIKLEELTIEQKDFTNSRFKKIRK